MANKANDWPNIKLLRDLSSELQGLEMLGNRFPHWARMGIAVLECADYVVITCQAERIRSNAREEEFTQI